MMKVQLIVVQGKPEGKVIPLVGPSFKIGRGDRCQLRPSSEEVSREHVEIGLSETAVTVRDLGSRNGSLLNGKPLSTTPVPVKNGDLIQIAKLTFAVSIQGAPASVASPARPMPARAGLSDDVSPDAIDQWLVADQSNALPDRPSGVYDGDTLTLNAFKEGGSGTHKAAPTPPPSVKPAAPAPKPVPAPAPVAKAPPPPPAPVPVVAVPVAAAPAPAPVAAPVVATPAVVAAPPPVAVSAPQPVAAVAPPARPAPAPVAAVAEPQASYLASFLSTHEFEQMPDAVSEAEETQAQAGASPGDYEEGEEGEPATSPSLDEEMMDESNPFYAAKKALQQQQPEAEAVSAAKKDPYKDTSDAASDILRKMMDRRRASRT